MQTSIGQSVLKGLKTDRKEFSLLSQQTGFLRFAFNWPLVINSLCFQTGRSFCKPSLGCPGSERTSFWLLVHEKIEKFVVKLDLLLTDSRWPVQVSYWKLEKDVLLTILFTFRVIQYLKYKTTSNGIFLMYSVNFNYEEHLLTFHLKFAVNLTSTHRPTSKASTQRHQREIFGKKFLYSPACVLKEKYLLNSLKNNPQRWKNPSFISHVDWKFLF